MTRLRIGDKFVTRLGKRRLLRVGDTSYFQKEQRRYFCVVVAAADESYRDSWNRAARRRVCVVQVLRN